LKSKIQTKLDQLDVAKESPGEARPFFRRTASLIAAAAAVIVLATAGFVGYGFYYHYQTYIPVEEKHWEAAKNPKAYDDGQVTFAALKEVYDDHQYAINTDNMGYTLVGAREESIGEVPVKHFVYQSNDEVISVFVASAEDMSIPDDLKETEVIRDGIKFYDHHCRGCRLVYHQVNDIIIVTATENHSIDLLSFEPGIGTI
jgi:hypothetical protein